jgi:hypothetical protein
MWCITLQYAKFRMVLLIFPFQGTATQIPNIKTQIPNKFQLLKFQKSNGCNELLI